ncbi:unnamed protein product [Amoebophrya sp. A120]|nr:unnamed protein product [Amoebophrya sp. A120]|eukprot:GSA120T00023025001.1
MVDFEDKKGKWSIASAELEQLKVFSDAETSEDASLFLQAADALVAIGGVNAAGPGRQTALHYAIKRQLPVEVVSKLASAPKIDLGLKDGWGDSALLMLCQQSCDEPSAAVAHCKAVFELLLGKILEKAKDEEDRAGEIRSSGCTAVLKTVLNAQNEMGQGALHILANQNASKEILDEFFRQVKIAEAFCFTTASSHDDETRSVENSPPMLLDLNLATLRGESPLMVAVHGGNDIFYDRICKSPDLAAQLDLSLQLNLGKEASLLDEGDGDSVLLYAIRNGSRKILQDLFLDNVVLRRKIREEELLNLANKKGTTPLIHACALGETELVATIFKCAELMMADDLLDASSADEGQKRKWSETLRALFSWERTVCSDASAAAPDTAAASTTILAGRGGETETTTEATEDEQHLGEGDDVSVEKQTAYDPDDILDLSAQDKRGNTCLHIAAAFGHAHIIQQVLEWSTRWSGGASTSLSEKDHSHRILRKKQKLQLMNPIDINEKNREGLSVLLLAAGSGRLSVVEAICQFQDGCLDLKTKDPKGRNARMRAKGYGSDDIEAFLKSYKGPRPPAAAMKGKTLVGDGASNKLPADGARPTSKRNKKR